MVRPYSDSEMLKLVGKYVISKETGTMYLIFAFCAFYNNPSVVLLSHMYEDNDVENLSETAESLLEKYIYENSLTSCGVKIK